MHRLGTPASTFFPSLVSLLLVDSSFKKKVFASSHNLNESPLGAPVATCTSWLWRTPHIAL